MQTAQLMSPRKIAAIIIIAALAWYFGGVVLAVIFAEMTARLQ